MNVTEDAATSGLPPFKHAVRFFADRSDRVGGVCDFLAAGARAGEPCLAAASAALEVLIRAELERRGFSKAAERVEFIDADQAAAELFSDASRLQSVFDRLIGARVSAAARGSRTGRARVYAEIVDVLRAQGRRDQALLVERLWSELAESVEFTLLCGYGADAADCDLCPWDYIEAHDVVLPAPAHAQDGAVLLERALAETLGTKTSMVRAVVVGDPRLSLLPFGQAALLWLGRYMPLAAKRALSAAQPPPPATAGRSSPSD